MRFVGQVQRLGWLLGDQGLPAGLFVFDEALVFVKLRAGLALGAGLRASKKEQEAISALAELDNLTPELVMDRWPKAHRVATSDIVNARLSHSLQGLATGAMRLEILLQDGTTHAYMASRGARESLILLLDSVLGSRFYDSSPTVTQSSLDALTKSREFDKP